MLFGEIKSENLVNGLIRLTMERTMLYTISWYISCASQGFDLRVPFREERERDEKVLTEEDKFNSSLACVLCPIVFES